MYLTINTASQFRDLFHTADRKDQFSYEALGILFDHFEEYAPDFECDVIAICCDYTEDTYQSIGELYNVILDKNDSEDDQLQQVKDFLETETLMLGVTEDKSIVYANF